MNDQITRSEIEELLKRLKEYQYAPLFLQPIEEVINSLPHYTNAIKQPIDLGKIISKFGEGVYNTLDEFKADVELMFDNCRAFNSYQKSWAYKAAETMQNFFSREYKKTLVRIEKQQNLSAQLAKQKSESVNMTNQNLNFNYASESANQNIQVISSSEDEKISKKIKNLFEKLGPNLDVTKQQREDIISHIVKSIVKRNKSFEQLYEDTMKVLSKNLNNTNNIKSYFSRKFRKLLRSIKEEQTEGLKSDKAIIKINFNESEEKREEKDKLDQIRKEVLNFIDNQKVPEVLRNVSEYPLEPSVRKKINSYVNSVRSNFISQY